MSQIDINKRISYGASLNKKKEPRLNFGQLINLFAQNDLSTVFVWRFILEFEFEQLVLWFTILYVE